jgi:hypothetical protein
VSKSVRVYPSTSLAPTEYLPGIGVDGAELPKEEAEDLHARGFVRYTRPSEADIATTPPAAPAEETTTTNPSAATPAEPAKK